MAFPGREKLREANEARAYVSSKLKRLNAEQNIAAGL